MLISASPGVVLWPAAMIVWGPGYVSSAHAHHSIQLVMALRGTVHIRGTSKQNWMTCGAALVKPDSQHEVEAMEKTVLLAFVESESELGAALNEKLRRDITPIRTEEVNLWRMSLGDPESLVASQVEKWIRGQLLSGRKAPPIHPRVKRVLRYLREQSPTNETSSLESLADVAGLSSSRLMHVFTESVGVPLRPYILWLKLQRASGELMRGVTATEAAHSAGFADAAHMTRTFRRMLGVRPTELAARSRTSQGAFLQSG